MKFFRMTLAPLLVFISFAAAARGLSPKRQPNELYEDARTRQYFESNVNTLQARRTYPEQIKKTIDRLDTSEIPEVGSYSDLENQFKYVRDSKMIENHDGPFPRRLTWLFPDDGCYARAEMAKFALIENNFPIPKKIYAFGNLNAATKNARSGWVQWWYHVAVTYRVGTNVYVIDPALEPHRPLKLEEWHELIGGAQAKVQYAICSANTFDPSVDCIQPKVNKKEMAIDEQTVFLEPEWDRLLELGRNPEKELGEFPPWH